MSITATPRKAGPYTCNGATVAFPFTFKVFAAADVRVVLTDADGVETDLTMGTDYTVSLNANQDVSPGGTVTTIATYATGYLVTLTSQVSAAQSVTLTNGGGFYPTVINDALDRQTILVQQLEEQVDRSAKFPISDSGVVGELPGQTVRANAFLAFDANGDPIAATGMSSAPATAFAATLLDDNTAADARATLQVPAAANGVHTGTTTMQTVAAQSISAAVSATAPTRAQADNGTDVATTAFVQAARLSKILTIDGTVAANALTITLQPCVLDFRSATLGSGTVNTRTVPAAITLTVPSSATLGTINAQQSRLVVLAIDNAGAVELAVVNISGGTSLSETGVISTTAISAGATSASTIYSTTARTNVAYRVVGYIESTQATAGTWATAPSTIQGVGGQALVSLNTLGGQTWQNVTGSRAFGTTYYNTTGRPIEVFISGTASANSMTFSITVDGTVIGYQGAYQSGNQSGVTFVVPPGKGYSAAAVLNCTLGSWFELR